MWVKRRMQWINECCKRWKSKETRNGIWMLEFFILSRENIQCLHASSQLITTRLRWGNSSMLCTRLVFLLRNSNCTFHPRFFLDKINTGNIINLSNYYVRYCIPSFSRPSWKFRFFEKKIGNNQSRSINLYTIPLMIKPR